MPSPSLADGPVDPSRFRPIAVRSRGGRAEVRADGVVVATDVAAPGGASRLGLAARGVMAFDSITIAEL